MLIVVDPRGERLFLLGRACLSAVGFEHSSPATVQALLLCGTFILNDKRMHPIWLKLTIDGNGAEIFWPMLGAAVKTAQSVGQFPMAALTCSSVYIEMVRHLDYQSMRLLSGGRSGGRSL